MISRVHPQVTDSSIKLTGESSVDELASMRRMRPVLGTLCAIEALGHRDALAPALSQAFVELVQIEQLMHPTRTGSDLARLAAQPRQPITVHAMTWEVLALAQHIAMLSEGCFDPCLPSGTGRLSDVELLPDNVVICHRPVNIDLGGIAKGYAVDRAVAALRERGCHSGIVNAGGDLRVFGQRAQQVVVKLEATEDTTLVLHEQAVAVSDAVSTHHPPDFQRYYIRGYMRGTDCAPLYRQVVVAAATTAVADALTKCAMYCNPTNLQQVLQALNATLLVCRDGPQ